MPFHTMWRMMGEGTYAVAIEPTPTATPAASTPDGASCYGSKPGEERSYRLEVGVLEGSEEISGIRGSGRCRRTAGFSLSKGGDMARSRAPTEAAVEEWAAQAANNSLS